MSAIASKSQNLAPGLVVAGLLAGCAYWFEEIEWQLTEHRVIEAMVVAILFGLLVRNTTNLPRAVDAGAVFVSKSVLELAVALFGAGINVQSITAAGPGLLFAIVLGVVLGMCISLVIGKGLGLSYRLAYLIAVGNSICGNSAIAAVAPVVKAERHEVASAIGLTAIAGVGTVLVLPILIPALNLSDYQYGIVAGMAVYAVPQVVAAAFSVSLVSGEIATFVKLVRVMLLGPLLVTTGIYMNARGGDVQRVRLKDLVPPFVAGFFALMVLRSAGIIPSDLADLMRDVARVLTIWAMAGLGLGVELAAIRAVGMRVGVVTVTSMALMLLISICLVIGFGLNS